MSAYCTADLRQIAAEHRRKKMAGMKPRQVQDIVREWNERQVNVDDVLGRYCRAARLAGIPGPVNAAISDLGERAIVIMWNEPEAGLEPRAFAWPFRCETDDEDACAEAAVEWRAKQIEKAQQA